MTDSYILAAVDPGDPAGVVVLRVPMTGDLGAVEVLELATVHRPSTTKMTPAEEWPSLDRRFREKFANLLYGADEVAYEDPVDARPHWQGQKGAVRENGETRYRQGAYYAAAVHAAPDTARVFAYPVKGRKGRPGWQGSRNRNDILRGAFTFLRARGAIKAGEETPSDHVLMAVGVALYHVEARRLAAYYAANPHLDPARIAAPRRDRLPRPAGS